MAHSIVSLLIKTLQFRSSSCNTSEGRNVRCEMAHHEDRGLLEETLDRMFNVEHRYIRVNVNLFILIHFKS